MRLRVDRLSLYSKLNCNNSRNTIKAFADSKKKEENVASFSKLLIRTFQSSSARALSNDRLDNNPTLGHLTSGSNCSLNTKQAGEQGTALAKDKEASDSGGASIDSQAATKAFDIDFLASRIGNYHVERVISEDSEFDFAVREENRIDAVSKAEKILSMLRNSLTEHQIGKIVQRLSQYSTLPRLTNRSKKQFLRSLQQRFGPGHMKEFELLLAFLEGRDEDWLRQIVETIEDVPSENVEPAKLTSGLVIGLSPELVTDPKFITVVLCYARLACLNSLRLIRQPATYSHADSGEKSLNNMPKKLSALWQVKNDFCKMLDAEGLGMYADAMGIRPTLSFLSDNGGASLSNRGGKSHLKEEEDPEWAAFNLESDRMDFRMLMTEMEEIVSLFMNHLSSDELANLLLSVLASLRTSKLHRKIFQEMVSNIQTRLPDEHQNDIMSRVVPFLSGNSSKLEDFQSPNAMHALQHHQFRHQAIIRSLLECRMRFGHLWIHDIDDVQEDDTVPRRLTVEKRQDIVTMAWNIANVLDNRQYHSFFNRFVQYKVAWRPNRPNFVRTFLDDIERRFGPECAPLLMPLFRKTFSDLSVETLTICRVKSRHMHKLVTQAVQLQELNAEGTARMQDSWRPECSIFYSNLPIGATEANVDEAFRHIGKVKNVIFFQHPIDGNPPLIKFVSETDNEADRNEIEIGNESVSSFDHEELDSDLDSEMLDEIVEESDFDHGLHRGPKVTTISAPVASESGKADKRRRRRVPKYKLRVSASGKVSSYCALVEFETASSKERALRPALQIFGVMMSGTYEVRAVFASDVSSNRKISIQNVAFGTPIRVVIDQINAILRQKTNGGLQVSLQNPDSQDNPNAISIPLDVMVTNGRIELSFPTYQEAAQVVDILENHVSQYKRIRPLSQEEEELKLIADKQIKGGDNVNGLGTTPGIDAASSYKSDACSSDAISQYRPFDVTWSSLTRSTHRHDFV
uniref:Uncharacterized protein AlNc14C2G360 n=1 Tax=Albugo laibachii Nc14 TaxID=890382 RepID=F0VZM2_9STRA|nr:conserved hypothetical protein [Albugo laibachii Nc14]|eukprot:CCA14252.1 conserved hypothetical protein [Albugo laibachii Nc14]